MTLKNYNYIAIDIAKDSLQVQIAQSSSSLAYDSEGLKQLLAIINKSERPFVICEATGGYERQLLAQLFKENIPLSLVNPVQVRAFAKSEGIRAKSDPIDAKVLLRFAQEKKLRQTFPGDPKREEIAALLDRRAHLSEQLAREKNRLQKSHPSIVDSIRKMITIIEEQIASIDELIEELIEQDAELKNQFDAMITVKGVGKITAFSILAFLPEVQHLSRNKVTALAGIAPFEKDSGKFKGKRYIQGGRAKLRKVLYMAAQCAAVHNEHIKKYVDGLRARGKPYKCAIVAAMRKLLIHIQILIKKTQIQLA